MIDFNVWVFGGFFIIAIYMVCDVVASLVMNYKIKVIIDILKTYPITKEELDKFIKRWK